MDGREVMSFSGGSPSYYMHRGGVGGSGSGNLSGGGEFQATPGFRPLSNPAIQAEPNSRGQGGGSVGSSSIFSVEPPHGRANFNHDIGIGSGAPSSEPVKKKRGRPRKYGPDGTVSLRLSPMSAPANSTQGGSATTLSQKKGRGRPPGSGRKQQLAALGEWMNSSAGLAFSPHVVTIGVGERPRALCVLSGTGTVSSVTLRQPASTNASVTFEGRFQILCLSGSYLVAEDGGPSNRTGGISVSLSSPDGHVIGGGVAVLIAGSPVQVVLCSFVYGGSKTKPKQGLTITNESGEHPQHNDKMATPASAPPGHNQNYLPSGSHIWPGPQPAELKNTQTHTGIDLTRG
ncbi:AT-hook motif nuclear-localized protein 5 isoform X2 [Vigna angularis]|uniref:AT-hook motif nuclear-localized protein 5 isoform X2 n=1 Tax=Phaseolus angularis TaxID=3914 RepID=UPI00080A7658|nr:AT-hook motif nuclear-localized protein 5 isoform X2 [Vigna angularis]